MFDRKSDYAVNKNRPDEIVYKSSSGSNTHLKSDNFKSEEEFQLWKEWSDMNYKEAEQQGRSFYDNEVMLSEEENIYMEIVPSAEDQYFYNIEFAAAEKERIMKQMELAAKLRSSLHVKQYRRLFLYYIKEMNEREIAEIEGVSQQKISRSLISGRKKLKKIFEDWSI